MSAINLQLRFGVIVSSVLCFASAKPNPGDFFDHPFFNEESNHEIFDTLSHFKNKIDQLHKEGKELNRNLNQDWDHDSQSFFDGDEDDFFDNIKTVGIVIFCAFSLICLSVLACCCLCPLCCLYKRRRGRVLAQGTMMNQTPTQSNYNQQQEHQQAPYGGQSPYPVQNSSQGFSQPGYPQQPRPESQPGYPQQLTSGGQPLYSMQPQGAAYTKPQESYNPNYQTNSSSVPHIMGNPANCGGGGYPEPPPPYPGLP